MRYTTRKALAVRFWLASTCLLIAQAVAQTQTADRPAVSVVTFESRSASLDDRQAMADELAARLVDTGRVRVLRREWLRIDRGPADPTVETLRASAAAAHLDELVFGEVTSTVTTVPPQLSIFPTASLRPVRPGALAAFTPGPSQRRSVFSVDVHILDVGSGEVLHTARVDRTRVTATPLPLVVPLQSRTATTAVRLTDECRKVIAEVARKLDFSRPTGRSAH